MIIQFLLLTPPSSIQTQVNIYLLTLYSVLRTRGIAGNNTDTFAHKNNRLFREGSKCKYMHKQEELSRRNNGLISYECRET